MAEVFQHTLIQCLTAVAQHHGLQISPERLISENALGNEEPGDLAVIRIAEDVGLKAKSDHLSWDGLLAQGGVFPLIARLTTGRAVIVVGVRGDTDKKVAVLDPLSSEAVVVLQDRATFCRQWLGQVIFVKREYKLSDPKQPFGFRWFIPEILKQKNAFRDILIAAVAMHVLGMASPIFFQLVIDKVLTHQSETTLWVLGAGMVLALVFDAVFGYLRQLLTLAATNKIDMRLTRRVFSHLLTLPIDYFETATAGVITNHMRQLERIRSFLTGRIFSTGLDAIALVIFTPILFFYSVQLALIVLVFTAMIAAIIVAMLPAYQRRLSSLYNAEGLRQSMLVETIHGMRTVKALAIEPSQRKYWDQRSAEAITMHYRVGIISITGNSITSFLGALLPVIIIVIGAQQVFDQTLT